MISNVEMLMPLATVKWIADEWRPNIIVGQWAEDMQLYEITVPAQLRTSLIILQNSLYDRIADVKNNKKSYDDAVSKLWGFIGE